MGEEKGNFERYMKTVKATQMGTLTHRDIAPQMKILVHEANRKLERKEGE